MSILDGENTDGIFRLVVFVDDDHPAPRAEHEAKAAVASAFEFPTEARERLEMLDRTAETLLRVGGQAMANDQPIECGDRLVRDDDPSYRIRLQFVERDAFAARELLATARDRLAGARDSVQDLDNRLPIDLGLVDSPREERACERTLGCIRLVGHPAQPRSVLLVEEDVDPMGSSTASYSRNVAQLSTSCACSRT